MTWSSRLRSVTRSPLARALVTVGLLAAAATRAGPMSIGQRLAKAGWLWFMASTGTLLVSLLLGALRWRLFLDAVGIKTTLTTAVRAHVTGIFTTSFLPSQIGGDVTRGFVDLAKGSTSPIAAHLAWRFRRSGGKYVARLGHAGVSSTSAATLSLLSA